MDAGRTIASMETPRVPRWAARVALWLATVAMLASSAGPCAADPSSSIEVHDRAGLLAAAASAKPGTRIALRAGYYGGGVTLTGLAGTAEQPIEIYAADPYDPPVFAGGTAFPGARTAFSAGQMFAHEGLTKVWQRDVFAFRDAAWHRVGQLPDGLAYGASFSLPEGLLLVGGEDENGTARAETRLMTLDRAGKLCIG